MKKFISVIVEGYFGPFSVKIVHMAFEKKILDTIRCPRCNATAELRLDQKPPKDNWVFVYIVCPTCRLNRYSHVTTRKAVLLQGRINKLKNSGKKGRFISDRISKLEEMKRGAERSI